MDIWTLIGTGAAVCVVLQWLPELWHAITEKTLRDLHWGLGILGITGATLWIAYGAHLQDNIIIGTNAIVLLCLVLLMLLKWTYRKN